VITGLIARHVLKAQRGAAGESKAAEYEKNQFWVARPFTRLIAWGRDYEHITKYMKKISMMPNDALSLGASTRRIRC
jgi:hypothetical protein